MYLNFFALLAIFFNVNQSLAEYNLNENYQSISNSKLSKFNIDEVNFDPYTEEYHLETFFPQVEYPTDVLEVHRPFFFKGKNTILDAFSDDVKSSFYSTYVTMHKTDDNKSSNKIISTDKELFEQKKAIFENSNDFSQDYNITEINKGNIDLDNINEVSHIDHNGNIAEFSYIATDNKGNITKLNHRQNDNINNTEVNNENKNQLDDISEFNTRYNADHNVNTIENINTGIDKEENITELNDKQNEQYNKTELNYITENITELNNNRVHKQEENITEINWVDTDKKENVSELNNNSTGQIENLDEFNNNDINQEEITAKDNFISNSDDTGNVITDNIHDLSLDLEEIEFENEKEITD